MVVSMAGEGQGMQWTVAIIGVGLLAVAVWFVVVLRQGRGRIRQRFPD